MTSALLNFVGFMFGSMWLVIMFLILLLFIVILFAKVLEAIGLLPTIQLFTHQKSPPIDIDNIDINRVYPRQDRG